ncbi:MAG: class I SAM-dependent methyltransferase [Candidatus Binatia bacterium]
MSGGYAVPTPTHFFRMEAVRALTRDAHRGRFLEVGVGSGYFLARMARRGLAGRGIDFSEEAVRVAAERITRALGRARIPGSQSPPRMEVWACDLFDLPSEEDGNYDWVFSFEVLEHIPDDRAAISRMGRLLRKGGRLVISVPAHTRRWGKDDEWAGHVRRYEREDLRAKVEEAGFVIESLVTYGVPALNMIHGLARVLARKPVEGGEEETRRTVQSGTDQYITVPGWARLILNDIALWPLYRIQSLFYGTDLGIGYVLRARRLKGA